jgi:hypothetical protein
MQSKNAGSRSLQQLKQVADEVAGGLEGHESGHKSRGWDALAPHRRRSDRAHPFVSCDWHLVELCLRCRLTQKRFGDELRYRAMPA